MLSCSKNFDSTTQCLEKEIYILLLYSLKERKKKKKKEICSGSS
jgi:hypothetical protein